FAEPSVAAAPVVEREQTFAATTTASVPGNVPASDPVADPTTPARPAFEWPAASALFVMVYAAAAVAIAGRWPIGVVRLRRARPAPAHVFSLFAEGAGADGKGIALLMSDRVVLPLMFGLGRPVILLPTGMCAAADPTELRYALAHEWSHIERHDLFRWHFA